MHPILMIAPFQDLADKGKKILRQRGLDIDIKVASDEKAIEIAKAAPEKSILISRGGTANNLKKLPERTVVEIRTTFSDVLVEIEKAVFAGYQHICVVTNDNIIDNVARDFHFFSVHVSLYPCKTHAEIRHMVTKFSAEGADFIIGCHQAVQQAEKLHLAHEYLKSGSIAINRAIDEALQIEHTRNLSQFQVNYPRLKSRACSSDKY